MMLQTLLRERERWHCSPLRGTAGKDKPCVEAGGRKATFKCQLILCIYLFHLGAVPSNGAKIFSNWNKTSMDMNS